MSKHNRILTLKLLDGRIDRLQKEIRDLRDIVFNWEEKNVRDIDELKKKCLEVREGVKNA